MKIFIAELLKNQGSRLEIDMSKPIDNIDLNGDEIKFKEPVKISGTIENENDILQFKGNIELDIELKCHKCAETFETKLDINVVENFSEDSEKAEEYYSIVRNEIDFTDMINDAILTNLPMKHICSEDCKGLCPVCGGNRNIKDCDCKLQDYDPRFEKLLEFKNKEI